MYVPCVQQARELHPAFGFVIVYRFFSPINRQDSVLFFAGGGRRLQTRAAGGERRRDAQVSLTVLLTGIFTGCMALRFISCLQLCACCEHWLLR